jgi:hypothetical protein
MFTAWTPWVTGDQMYSLRYAQFMATLLIVGGMLVMLSPAR